MEYHTDLAREIWYVITFLITPRRMSILKFFHKIAPRSLINIYWNISCEYIHIVALPKTIVIRKNNTVDNDIKYSKVSTILFHSEFFINMCLYVWKDDTFAFSINVHISPYIEFMSYEITFSTCNVKYCRINVYIR